MMKAIIHVHGFDFTLEEDGWHGHHQPLADLMNTLRPSIFTGPHIPDPDNLVAKETADFFGGKVIQLADPLPFDPDVVY